VAVTGIGEELRRERTRQGLTLEDVARRTRIPIRSLDAIETEAFERLPGVVFARNFVRIYAVDLKLDAEALITRLPKFDLDSAPMPDPPRRGREKWDPRVKAAVVSAVWLMVAGAAGAGAWYYYNNYGRTFIAAVEAAPAPQMTAPPAAPVALPEEMLLPAESGAPEESGSVSLDGNRPVQVVLTARDVVWVRVSADGRKAFVGTLHPNDTRTIAADDQVKVLTGNAGGLDISLNGKTLDPLGTKGQIRTVRLTAEGPQFGSQSPPVSSPL
jgi:transcriptional regulator with XRE-family HTH domain